MDRSFVQRIYQSHQECTKCPSTPAIVAFFDEMMGLLFPPFSQRLAGTEEDFEERIRALKLDMDKILYNNLLNPEDLAEQVVEAFFQSLPEVYDKLQKDIEATYSGDPAARSRDEVIRAYPGFYAVAAYRVAHLMHQLGIRSVPRMITEHAHSRTGIDIHPGAKIGEHFCIDHGTGIVVGETAIIGNYVKLYQGVTLGALSVSKQDASIKRHPTIEDHVVLYAGATILGGNTTIGHHSIVGGNVWLTKSIPPHSKVYYQAQMHNTEEGQIDLIVLKH
jgi:serine O-acetyltransferase